MERNQQLESIQSYLTSLSAISSFEMLFTETSQIISNLLDAEFGALLLLDSITGELWTIDKNGHETRFPPASSVISVTVMTGMFVYMYVSMCVYT